MSGKSSSISSKKRAPSAAKKTHNEVEEPKKYVFWPEWTEAELNAEKWDTSGKGKDKGKGGGGASNLYEDPDQPRLPPSFTTVCWKRAAQYFHDLEGQSEMNLVPTVVSNTDHIDLVTSNEHLLSNKLMCKIISELQLLWKVRSKIRLSHLPEQHDPTGALDSWSPWQHIHPWPKGQPTPVYNPQGKYCIRIHWMGKWRKITIDDQLPVDSNNRVLLPMSVNVGELWPALITKALLKVINLECTDLDTGEHDTSAMFALTGWFGEQVSLSGKSSWNVIQPLLRKWEREQDNTTEGNPQDTAINNEGIGGHDSIVVAFYQPYNNEETPIDSAGPFFTLSDHAHPIIMSEWRDEPLQLPPLEPPLPPLEAPYYLGLCNRKPRPGYPPPPPPKTDHRSFQVYSPLYIDNSTKPPLSKPNSKSSISTETVVSNNTSTSSHNGINTTDSNNQGGTVTNTTNTALLLDIWIDLDEFEGTFSKIMIFHKPDKFPVALYNDNMPSTSTTPAPGVKKGVSTQQVQTLPIKATGNIFVIDHSEDDPVTVFINYSSISSWFETGDQKGLEPVPTLGLSFSEDKEIVRKVSENTDDNDEQATPTKDTTPTWLVPGSLTIQEYTWQHCDGTINNRERFGEKGLLKLTTTSTKTISMRFPKGRCVLRLQMSSPLGYHVVVYSTVPIIMGKEDEVWDSLKKPSACFLGHGQQVLEMLIDHSSVVSDQLQLMQNIFSNQLTKLDCRALRVSILRVFHVLGSEIGLTTSQIYIWKSRIIKLMEDIGNCIEQDQQNNGEEQIVHSSSGSSINMLAMREVPLMLDGREVKYQAQDKGEGSGRKSHQLKKQKVIEGSSELDQHVNELGVTEDSQDENDEDNSAAVIAESIPILEDNKTDIGVAIFKCLHAAKPDVISDNCPFGTTIHSRVFHNMYQGVIPSVESKGWTLLFRDTFTVPCPQTISFKLTSPCVSCVVKVINNDTGLLIGTDITPININPNERGYTLLGEVWSFSDPIEGKEGWSIALLSSSPHLPVITSLSDTTASLTTSFNVMETKKYYLPDRDYQMLRYSVIASGPCQITIQLSTSKQDACFMLKVYDCGHQVIGEVEGCGHCVLPSLFLLPIQEDTSEGDQPVTKPHQYTIHVTTLYDTWTSDDSAWPYVSMIKNTQKEAAQSNKPSSGKKSKSRGGGGSKTPKLSNNPIDSIDVSKPHWVLRVVVDAKDSQVIKVEEDKTREDELKMMQQVWERDQPGRTNKAMKLRQKFLETYALNKEDLPSPEEERLSVAGSEVGTASSGSGINLVPNFGPVLLKPFDHSQFNEFDDSTPPVVITPELESVKQTTKLNLIKEYREWRKEVNLKRESEAKQRDGIKQMQIEQAELWQTQLDDIRNTLNEPRERIRERNLAKLRTKTPTEDAASAARPSSKGKDGGKAGKTPKGKKK